MPDGSRKMTFFRAMVLCLMAAVALGHVAVAWAQDAEVPSAAEVAIPKESEASVPVGSSASSNLRVVDPAISLAELSHLVVPLTKSELETASRAWLEIVRDRTREIAELQAERVRTPADGDDPRVARIVQLIEQRARLLERFTLVVESLERKGGDEALVAELKAYRQAILYEETSLASTRALAGSLIAWLGRSDGGIAFLQRIFVAILALVAIVLIARFVRGFARIWIRRFTHISKVLQGFIVGAVFWVFVLIGLAIVLSSVNVDITPLFALIGGASFILAFAFQDTLGNLASGLMIMINQPFDEGDFIEVGGVGGTVKNVGIVGTTIATPDNRIIVVPNKNVWGNVIVNATASDIRRVDLVVGASYDDSIQDVLNALVGVVTAHPKILADPEPDIRASELASNAVNFVCRPWVRSEDYWDVYCDLTRQIKEAFEESGLSMPFQQQDIHIKSVPDQLLSGTSRQGLA